MNMRILKPSRKKPKLGDVFVLQIRDGEYVYGRVISLEASIGGFEKVILVYVYNAFSASKERIPVLDKNGLLIPPLGTNRQPWLKGYFETIVNKPLSKDDILPKHCLRHPDYSREEYYDDKGNRLLNKVEPCGVDALDSYRTIDDTISAALGIPAAPD